VTQLITTEEVMRIAKAVAARYARRCWWADRDDLVSEATFGVLEARRTFDPQVGVPFDGYAAKAAAHKVGAYLWRQSSPVSGGMGDPRKNIAGVHAAPTSAIDGLSNEHDITQALDEEAYQLRVRRRLRRLAERSLDGDLAIEVMVRGKTSGEVIRETGRDAYRAVELLRRKAKNDYGLYKLWRMGP